MDDWAPTPPLQPTSALTTADAIFVLAGRKSRKPFGVELFRRGVADTLILSVGRFEVRYYAATGLPRGEELRSMARQRAASERHFFVVFRGPEVDIVPVRIGAFGTLTEIAQLGKWLSTHAEIKNLVMVSSGFHLRRVALCCEALIPWCRFQYVASPDDMSEWSWRRRWRERWVVLKERIKLPLYRLLLARRPAQPRLG